MTNRTLAERIKRVIASVICPREGDDEYGNRVEIMMHIIADQQLLLHDVRSALLYDDNYADLSKRLNAALGDKATEQAQHKIVAKC